MKTPEQKYIIIDEKSLNGLTIDWTQQMGVNRLEYRPIKNILRRTEKK